MESTSLVKALALLEATAAQPEGRSLAALAAEVALAKPTAHRILKTLSTLGYLERGEHGVYRQTPRVQRLVSNRVSDRLLAASESILRQLHITTQETVNMAALRADQIVYLLVLESTQPLRRVATPTSTDPFYSTALGRAIAAHLPGNEYAALLKHSKFIQRTPHTNIDRTLLNDILVEVVREGYSLEVDENDVGVTCIGAPLLELGYPLGAISISVPTARATGDALSRLIDNVRGAASQINHNLLLARTSVEPPGLTPLVNRATGSVASPAPLSEPH